MTGSATRSTASSPAPREMVRFVELDAGEVDLATGRTTLSGGVRLSERECALLARLAQADGAVVPHAELGPGVDHNVLQLAVLRLRRKIEPDPALPRHVLTVHGVGYRLDVRPRAAASGAPPERGLLLGRATAIAEVEQGLAESGFVAVVGPGGVGKTALAVRVAHRSARPAVFVEAADARSLPELVAAVARAVGASAANVATADALRDRVLDALGRRGPVLLVLDNLEQLAGHGNGLLSALRRPTVALLCTSRAALQAGERRVDLGPLDLAAARAVWEDRTGRGDEPELDELLDQLDRLPLAIELAAARRRAMSASAMLARLGARFRLLRDPAAEARHAEPGEAPQRLASLRASLEWSWSLLTGPQQAALVALAVFARPADRAAAEVVVGADAAEHLRALVDASLAREEGDAYALAESVRAFAREVGGDAVAEAELRHAEHFAAQRARICAGPLDPRHLARVDRDLDELLAVGRVVRRAPDLVVPVAISLHDRFQARGPIEPYLALLDEVVPVALAARHPRLAELLLCRAAARRQSGRAAEALADGELAAELGLRSVGLDSERGAALSELGRWDEARQHLEAACAGDGPPSTVAVARANLAALLLRSDPDSPRIEPLLRDAIAVADAAGQSWHAACFGTNLGMWLQQRHRLAEAEDVLVAALGELRRHGGERRAAIALLNLAAVRTERGDRAGALAIAREAEDALIRAGRPWALAWCRVLRAQIHLLDGAIGEALDALGLVEEAARAHGDRVAVAHSRMYAAVALALRGDPAGARAALADLPAAPGDPRGPALAAAFVARASGEPADPPLDPAASDSPVRFLTDLWRATG